MRPSARLVSLSLLLSIASLPDAWGLGRDTRSVLVASGYGVVAGTVVGLASYPVSGDKRTIFIGSSIGLYFGLALGVYHVLHRDDPGNPFRAEEGAGATPDLAFSKIDERDRAAVPAPIALAYPVLRF